MLPGNRVQPDLSAPVPATERSSAKAIKVPVRRALCNVLRSAYDQFAQSWHRIQIGNRQQYSVERALAFRDYSKRTSRTRVFVVCLLTPAPAFVVLLLIECLPLKSPEEGWEANKTMWVRMLISSAFVAGGIVFLGKTLISEAPISTAQAIAISIVSAISYTLMGILLAALWKFPVPFGLVIMVCPFVTVIMTWFLICIGARELKTNQKLQKQLVGHTIALSAQTLLVVAYPTFNAVFLHLDSVEQAIFTFVLPVIKFIAKQITARVSAHIRDFLGVTIVFSVDVFNVLYVAICMQTARSLLTTALVMSSDTLHLVLALRNIYYHTRTSKVNSTGDHINAVERVLSALETLKPRAKSCSGTIRVFGPYKLPLSAHSKFLLDEFDQKLHGQNVVKTATNQTKAHSMLTLSARSAAPVSRRISHSIARRSSKSVSKASVPSTYRWNALVVPEPSGSQDKFRAGPQYSAIKLSSQRANTARTSVEKAIEEGLQVLFHCEYVILTEYVECTLPIFYAAYLAGLYHLPTAAYYPFTRSMTATKMASALVQLVIYAFLELGSFVGLYVLLKQRLGYSPGYQLAFVLETHAVLLQSLLFIWIIFIAQLTLVHGGVDFEAPFK